MNLDIISEFLDCIDSLEDQGRKDAVLDRLSECVALEDAKEALSIVYLIRDEEKKTCAILRIIGTVAKLKIDRLYSDMKNKNNQEEE